MQGGVGVDASIADVKRHVQRVVVGGLHQVRSVALQVQGVARRHHQFGLHRPHGGGVELVQVDPARRLALVHEPFLVAGQLHHQHVGGIEVAAIGLAALGLREKHHRVRQHALGSRVNGAAHGVDLRIEYVDAFEHQRGAVGQVFLQDALVEERRFGSLYEFVPDCGHAVDFLALPIHLEKARQEQRVVEMRLQVLDAEKSRFVDQAFGVNEILVRGQFERGLIIEIAQLP